MAAVTRLHGFWCLAACLLVAACKEPQPTQAPAAAPAPPAAAATPPSPALAAAPEAQMEGASAAATATADRAGWTPLQRQDDLPLCVFASYAERERAPLLQAAKTPQKLRANAKLVFGVFGPHCLNEACDERPNLQCWVERDGPSSLLVHARFSSLHKDGGSCTQDCMELDVACETDELAPGKYKLRYGDKTYKLTIPSSLRDPCLRRE